MAKLRSQALLLVLLCLLSCASWVRSVESDSHDVRHPDIDESEFEDENVVGEEEETEADDSESYEDEEEWEFNDDKPEPVTRGVDMGGAGPPCAPPSDASPNTSDDDSDHEEVEGGPRAGANIFPPWRFVLEEARASQESV